MSMNPLVSHFKNYFPLSEQESEALSTRVSERRVKRRQFILQQDDICRHYNFVISGCFRMYAVDLNGAEHNLQFAVENDWVTDFSSFYSEKPSRLYIEAIEPSLILQIRKADLLHLFINYPKFDRNFRIITERKYIELQDRVLSNISSTAHDRYVHFIEQYPELSNRLPNTQIASYLGITPEFLSKIRKEFSKRNT